MIDRRAVGALVGALSLAAAAPSVVGCDGSAAGPGESRALPSLTPHPPTGSVTVPAPKVPSTLSQHTPPPITGGTMVVLADGKTAVAADPELDLVSIVDLDAHTVVAQTVLLHGDEPGRVVEDPAGLVHVALRRGGALVSIDVETGAVTARRPVCPAPRGVAYDASAAVVHVACADGRLVTLPAAGGAAVRTVRLDDDLRDVVVQGSRLFVSRFRAADILEVAPDGTIAQRITMPTSAGFGGGMMGPTTMVPEVAWRMIGLPDGRLAVLHQRGQVEPVSTDPGGYAMGGMCPGSGILEDTVTIVTPDMPPQAGPPLGMIVLGVDFAVSPDGAQLTVAAPGTTQGASTATYPFVIVEQPGNPCALPNGPSFASEVTSVAYDGQGRLVTLAREPSEIYVDGAGIPLSVTSVASSGHATFHQSTVKGSIACASCHPEGGEDGRVWTFANLGSRRTQDLRGGVLARTPFHWSGDITGMDDLVQVVLVGRMGGEPLDQGATDALGAWMDAQPALAAPAPDDAAAVARGQQVFEDPTVGCAACHGGPQLSNHSLVDVGTGGVFKVPSLVAVRYRAPYLHDGCAATLRDRFGGACGGGEQHGHTAQLDAGQMDDLIAYLESL
jgi:mono/diheme cytochrome c family protein